MSIRLKVYDNGDHTALVWLSDPPQSIANCRGFTIERTLNGAKSYLHSFVGFSEDQKLDPAAPWKLPLQRYMWWDYGVKPDDKVSYRVIPVVGPNKDSLQLDEANASPVSAELTVTGQCTPHLSAYFNKGIVSAQWVSRAVESQPKGAKVKELVATKDNTLRNALSGLLRPRLLGLLADAKANGDKVYLALYELNDVELIAALVALGDDCHLVLGNGAFKTGEPDENATVRANLRAKVNVYDRIVTGSHFAHNKFAVFCDKNDKPYRVLTGSTNWTSNGLCTQANNAVIVDDAGVAADYLAAWNRLKEAGNDYPKELVDGNSTSTSYNIDGATITPWFVKTSAAQDLAFARKLIDGAKEGILFLFFNPGAFQEDPSHWTLLQNILERHNPENPNADPNLYFCGVVNQDIPMLTKAGGQSATHDPAAADPAPVTLIKSGIEPPERLSHDVLVPANIKKNFAEWVPELISFGVNIHSKVIVIDPFGDHPVVMTGSHNLGFKASSQNDDNLMIIENHAPLAAAFAINIVAIFQAYRWNHYVEQNRTNPQVWHGLVDNDTWQSGYLQGAELDELRFWLGDKRAAVPAAIMPAKSAKIPIQAKGKARPKPAAPKPPAHKRTASKSHTKRT